MTREGAGEGVTDGCGGGGEDTVDGVVGVDISGDDGESLSFAYDVINVGVFMCILVGKPSNIVKKFSISLII